MSVPCLPRYFVIRSRLRRARVAVSWYVATSSAAVLESYRQVRAIDKAGGAPYEPGPAEAHLLKCRGMQRSKFLNAKADV